MRHFISFILMISVAFFSCKSKKKERPDTALDTGRLFIRATLDGNFKEATPLLLQDEENKKIFEGFQIYYEKMTEAKKTELKNSLYQINNYLDLNDSVTLINYSNEFINKPMDIKIVKKQNIWFVDYKYAYSGNLPLN